MELRVTSEEDLRVFKPSEEKERSEYECNVRREREGGPYVHKQGTSMGQESNIKQRISSYARGRAEPCNECEHTKHIRR